MRKSKAKNIRTGLLSVPGESPYVHDVPIDASAMPGLADFLDKPETKYKNSK